MKGMFHWAIAFNRDLSDWNTEAVWTMEGMFIGAGAFISAISNWNTAANMKGKRKAYF
jgi:hypothetical protein